MKHLVAIYFLTAILCSCSQAKGFRFGDFFFGDHDTSDITIKRSSEPQKEELLNTTIPGFSEKEVDLVNATFDEEFVDSSSLLNSSESLIVSPSRNSSVLEEVNATTKQSVKKQLSNAPPATPSTTTSPSVHVTEQDTSDSMRNSATSSVDGLKVTSNADELEEVVLGTTKTPAIVVEKTVYQKTIEWVKDTYTLSIVIPVAAGVLFATTCIVTIALCSCLRRCCRRRRLKRKILPDSVKSLRASDRKRLLGDCSSDEEF